MNYKKKYEEAERLYRTANADQRYVLESLFPELKESEDEKIRKELIDIVAKSPITFAFEDKNKVLSWLEKQGEQKPTLPKWKYKKDNTTLLKDSLVLNKCGHMAKLSSGAIVSDVWVLDYDELAKLPKEELEEQGEQNPTDNVEPKFKVGDWVVSPNGVYWHIDAIQNGRYEVTADTGQYGNWSLNTNIYRLWTIQDAKDGDILCTPNGNTFIFKTIDGDKILDYCGLYFNKFFSDSGSPNGSSTHYDKCNYHPATKEQRDLLFAKMKEAGYEWDADKKELKKADVELTDFEKSLKHIMIETLECGDTHNLKADAEMLLRFAQKPAWSEEDEVYLNTTIAYLKDAKDFKKTAENCIDWLKKLKQRIAP